jgi:uncharacterized protein with GYD domain
MSTYVSLANFTERGVAEYAKTTDRAEDTRQLARGLGGEVQETYWTMGPYDVVLVADFPDDESATAFALALSSRGFLRTTTMRAFNGNELRGVVSKVG